MSGIGIPRVQSASGVACCLPLLVPVLFLSQVETRGPSEHQAYSGILTHLENESFSVVVLNWKMAPGVTFPTCK